MTTETIQVKQLLANNKPLPAGYVQSTLSYTLGLGETTVRTAVNGNTTTRIISENLETKKSMLKFEIYPIDRNDETDPRPYVKNLKSNLGNNTFTAISNKGKTLRFTGMVLMNDPEFADNPDGTIPLEFEGDEVQIS
jgi:hypothetical protein